MKALTVPFPQVHINSNGLVFSVVLLFLTVILTVSHLSHVVGSIEDSRGQSLVMSCYIFLDISRLLFTSIVHCDNSWAMLLCLMT